MSNTHIPVVLGTARTARKSETVARLVADTLAKKEGITSELVDVKDHVAQAVTIPSWGEGGADSHPSKWLEVIQKTDALTLVIPEYNHGYPGELKLLLDSLYEHYKGIPVAIIGVSAGTLGGARVIDHIKPILSEMHLHPIRASVNFSKVGSAFTEDGSLVDEKVLDYIHSMIDELQSVAHALAPLRQKRK